MKINSEDEITFGENISSTLGSGCQSIIHNGNEIGALLTISQGLLMPLREIYQRVVLLNEFTEKFAHYEAEDVGHIAVNFETLEEFIAYYNQEKEYEIYSGVDCRNYEKDGY